MDRYKIARLSTLVCSTMMLSACGETKTIQSLEKLSGKKSSPLLEAQKDEKSSEVFPSVSGENYSADSIRVICDDGSSFTSMLTTSMEASDQAYASRIIPEVSSDSEESELVLNVRQPVVSNRAGSQINYLFEGSLANNSSSTGDLFTRYVFIGTFDYSTRSTKVLREAPLDEVEARVEARARDLGMNLRSYGISRPSKTHILPENFKGAGRGYVWKDSKNEWQIPCFLKECFNPSSREGKNGRYILFDRHNSSRNAFEIELFLQESSGNFMRMSMPIRGEAYGAQFVDEETVAWLENENDENFWVSYDLQTNARRELSLKDLVEEASKFMWSSSFNEKDMAVVAWSESGKLQVARYSKDSSSIERVETIDVADLIDKEDPFAVHSFQLIERNTALISFSTLLGPRLFKIDLSGDKAVLSTLTRSNCATFSLVAGGNK